MTAIRNIRDLMQKLEDEGNDRDATTGERSTKWKNLFMAREDIRNTIGYLRKDSCRQTIPPSIFPIKYWVVLYDQDEPVNREQFEMSQYGIMHMLAYHNERMKAEGLDLNLYLHKIAKTLRVLSGQPLDDTLRRLNSQYDIGLTQSEMREMGEFALQDRASAPCTFCR